MTRTQLSAIAIALSTMLAGQAMAADNVPVTRAQVKAELAEAIRTGNMLIDEGGQRLNEMYAQNYRQPTVASKTRDEVRRELAEAMANGAYRDNIPA